MHYWENRVLKQIRHVRVLAFGNLVQSQIQTFVQNISKKVPASQNWNCVKEVTLISSPCYWDHVNVPASDEADDSQGDESGEAELDESMEDLTEEGLKNKSKKD